MSFKQLIEKHFSKEQLLDTFVRYELYFHLGLGRLVHLSMQDLELTFAKMEELNLQIEFNTVVNTIYYIIYTHGNSEDFEQKFDYYIRASAMSQALEEFCEKDEELMNGELFSKQMHDEIYNDRIFGDDLKKQFDLEYDNVFEYFAMTITDDVAKNIKDVILTTYDQA